MASANPPGGGGGGCGGEENDPFDPPKTPRMVLKEGESADVLPEDTPQHVLEMTDSVFRNFVYHMLTNERGRQDADDTPNLPELTAFTDPPLAQAAIVGRQLAMIGDDINRRYRSHFHRMIQTLDLTPETAYEAFAGVARKVFRHGEISWGRIVTLLCLGYNMAVSVIQQGIRGLYSNIVGFIGRFFEVEHIAEWIARQGGWRAAMRYIPESVGWPTLGGIFGFAALTVVLAYYLSRK